MRGDVVTKEQIQTFEQKLIREEKSPVAVAEYLRDMAAFSAWLGDRPVSKDASNNGKPKGKNRVILLPGKVRRRLLCYPRERRLTFRDSFRARSGRSIFWQQIWAEELVPISL